MLKAGMLPAPVIQPMKFDTIGTRIRIGPNTYIQIRSDVPGARILFTTDGTKPDPFQAGRTGKQSTHRYIGPFRLQVGNRVVKAIVVSRDRLRESAIATRYIDVMATAQPESGGDRYGGSGGGYISDRDGGSRSSSTSGGDEESQFMRPPPNDIAELQGSVEGPINPVNYSGTQINVWGFPTPELANYLAPKQPTPQMGYLTEQMIKNLNTPRAIESKPASEMSNLPETLRKFFKQIQKLYERDSDFQKYLDYLIENGQLKSAEITQTPREFEITMSCPKFLIDEPPPEKVTRPPPVSSKPKPPPPRPRPVSPEPEVVIPKPAPTKRPVTPPPKIMPVVEEKPKREEPVKRPPSPPPPPRDPTEPSVYVEELQQHGTLVDAPNFNAEKDAEALRKSVKGLGTKESVIIGICGNRSNPQRLKIKDTYKAMFGRDLVEDLKGDTSGNFKKLLVALFMSPIEYDCMEIRKAIQGLGTDNSTLIELLTSRSNKRLKDVSALYYELYKKKMEDDIRGDTSGHYRNLLTSLLAFSRPETSEVDMNLVRQDVDELVKAGVKKWGTDESKFNTIFGTRSYAHLRQLFDEYERVTKRTMEDTIKSEMSGNLQKTYLALIANIRSRPVYFAKEVKKSIKGLGTDEHTLNRIVVSRCEVDMKQIKEEYTRLYSTTMEKDVSGDVSGDYGKLLLELIKEPSERVYEGSTAPDVPHEIEQVEEPHIEETPTITDFPGFNPNSDAERLRKAMKGLGTDEKTIIEIIPRRSNKQRQQLKTTFQAMFGRDLVQDLHSELSGHFRDAIEACMMPLDEFEAFSYRKAVKGFGTDDSALIELLTTRSTEQISATKIKYKQMYGRDLEADVQSDTSGHYRKVLTSLLTASRPSGNMVDKTQARIDCEELIKAGIKKWGTDESKFITILCTRSYSQLRFTFVEYKSQSGHELEDDIKKEMSGDLQKIFLSIIACVKDKQAYFAQVLYKAMKGLGTKESSLIRVIVGRCEIDMVQIKQKFEEAYKKSLRDFLKGDLSGDFLKTMLPLIGE